jgi:acyl-CoA synthetase (AMP-forming)/AMP-acid ligase II
MACWMNLGQNFKVNAKKFPNTVALKDNKRSYTYPEANIRVNKLAHSLNSLGLEKGDKVAVLMENSIEIIEIYLATAKTGLVIVPINFRLVSSDVEYISNNSDAKAFIVHDQFVPTVDPVKSKLKNIKPENYIVVGGEPDAVVKPEDIWILIYTSGTTGKPKGVVRSHESHISFYLINAADFGFNEHNVCMNVMPLCHINSTFFTFTFTYIGATVYVHPAQSFRAEEILEIVHLFPSYRHITILYSMFPRKEKNETSVL